MELIDAIDMALYALDTAADEGHGKANDAAQALRAHRAALLDAQGVALEVLELAAKASGGPWEWCGNALEQTGAPYAEVISTDVSCGAYCLGGQWSPCIEEGNKNFIAHARTSAPLLAAVIAGKEVRDAH